MECNGDRGEYTGEMGPHVEGRIPNEGKTKIYIQRKNDDGKNSQQFPNFAALTKEEKLAFFEALSAARRNVEKSGAQARETFGTVHDEYLDYFAASSTTSFATQGTYTVSGIPEGSGEMASRVTSDEVFTTEEANAIPGPRAPKPGLHPPDLRALSAWETMLHEDRDKMVDLYLKKRRSEEDKERPRTRFRSDVGAPKEKETPITTEERSDEAKGTPKFDALTPEEKKLFFKILEEAHDNVYQRSPGKDILPLESILKRYQGKSDAVAAFATRNLQPNDQRTQKEEKNLRVKVTLTSVDNERLQGTVPQTPNRLERECPPKPIPSEKDCCKTNKDDTPDWRGEGTGKDEDDDTFSQEENSQIQTGFNSNDSKSGRKDSRNPTGEDPERNEKPEIWEESIQERKSLLHANWSANVDLEKVEFIEEKKEEVLELRTSVIEVIPEEETVEEVSKSEDSVYTEDREDTTNYPDQEENMNTNFTQEKASWQSIFTEVHVSHSDENYSEEIIEKVRLEADDSSPRTDVEAETEEDRAEEKKKNLKSSVIGEVVLDKLKDLMSHMESRGRGEGSQGKEYLRMLSDYVEYLSDVMNSFAKVENEHLATSEKNRGGTDGDTDDDDDDDDKDCTDAFKISNVRAHSSLTSPDVYLKFKESVKQRGGKEGGNVEMWKSASHSDIHQRRGSETPNVDEGEISPLSKKKDVDGDSSSLVLVTPSVQSISSTESDGDDLLVPMFVRKKRLPTTKIRILQDLLKGRAEFVPGSIREFKIVSVPHEEIESSESPTIRFHVEEEEEVRSERGTKSKFFKTLAKLCRCGKKDVTEEDNILENLKGEAVAVDVSKATKNPASVTQNESTMEVLKAAERKKIIQKYWKTS